MLKGRENKICKFKIVTIFIHYDNSAKMEQMDICEKQKCNVHKKQKDRTYAE